LKADLVHCKGVVELALLRLVRVGTPRLTRWDIKKKTRHRIGALPAHERAWKTPNPNESPYGRT
jgi:hypothetical protein